MVHRTADAVAAAVARDLASRSPTARAACVARARVRALRMMVAVPFLVARRVAVPVAETDPTPRSTEPSGAVSWSVTVLRTVEVPDAVTVTLTEVVVRAV